MSSDVKAFMPEPPAAAVDAVELVLDQDLALLGDQLVELLLQFAVARRLVLRLEQVVDFAAAIRRAHLPLLLAHLVADAFLLGDDFEVLLVILRADGRRALEHHVLEEVRDAGHAEPSRSSCRRAPPSRRRRSVRRAARPAGGACRWPGAFRRPAPFGRAKGKPGRPTITTPVSTAAGDVCACSYRAQMFRHHRSS